MAHVQGTSSLKSSEKTLSPNMIIDLIRANVDILMNEKPNDVPDNMGNHKHNVNRVTSARFDVDNLLNALESTLRAYEEHIDNMRKDLARQKSIFATNSLKMESNNQHDSHLLAEAAKTLQAVEMERY